jgi:hypothetical protein
MDDREKRFDRYMRKLTVDVAMRWCEPAANSACACTGCANRSGGLEARGFTKADWKKWWASAQISPGLDEP